MKKTLFILSLLATQLLLFQNQAKAGFPIGQGKWLLVPTYNYYSATKYWDAQRVVTPYPKNGRFSSNYLGLYGGYGIKRNLDFIFNVPFIIQTYSDTDSLKQLSSLGDVNLGLSYYFNSNDYNKHLSLTGSVIIPFAQSYASTSSSSLIAYPAIGYHAFGVEAKFGYAGTNTTTLKNVYWDMEVGLRQYFSYLGPTQFFFNATMGVPLNDDWKLFGSMNYVTSHSNATFQSTSDGVNRDFDYLRFTIGILARLSKNASVGASIFTDVTGRNIGCGSGFSLFAVFKF
jgi:hypothetical protein